MKKATYKVVCDVCERELPTTLVRISVGSARIQKYDLCKDDLAPLLNITSRRPPRGRTVRTAEAPILSDAAASAAPRAPRRAIRRPETALSATKGGDPS